MDQGHHGEQYRVRRQFAEVRGERNLRQVSGFVFSLYGIHPPQFLLGTVPRMDEGFDLLLVEWGQCEGGKAWQHGIIYIRAGTASDDDTWGSVTIDSGQDGSACKATHVLRH